MQTTLSPNSLATELLDLLQEEQTRFDTFLELLNHERNTLRALSSTELETLNAAKLDLLNEIQTLERRRIALVSGLSAEWRVPPASLTLRAIGERLGGSIGRECGLRQDRLNATLEAIRQASALNGSVIAKSLAFLDQALSLVRARPAPPPIYSPSAAIVSAAPDGALIERKG
jgi:flagellar biosynthesis/type III secretory pathway chaperone